MTANIHKLYAGGVVSREQQELLQENDEIITSCISQLKEAGIPQGLIVAVLHAHTTEETLCMLNLV